MMPADAMTIENKSLFLRRTLLLLGILFIGVIHFFLATQAIQASVAGHDRDGGRNFSLSLSNHQHHHHHHLTSLALVRNELLDTKPPTQIIVIGEIHSGAEYAADVLKYAFGNATTQLHASIIRRDLLDDAELKYVASRTDILWVVTVRSPCHWADAVIQLTKSFCEDEGLTGDHCEAYANASEEDYFHFPWYDLQPSSDAHNAEGLSNNIIIKNKIDQESRYDDIFDMRRRNLLLMKQIIDLMPRHAKILRLGEFELNPYAFVTDLMTEYNFKTRDQYNLSMPAIKRGNQSSFSCMESYSKWNDAQQRIDWTLEGYFGHNRLDCHLCLRGSGQVPAAPSATSSIYILGERNSGTTFVSNTLAKAFDPPNTMGSNAEKFASDIPVLLHKHMFRHDLLDESELAEIRARDDIIWIMVVRSPCEWAEAMFRKPYHMCPPTQPEKCGPSSDPSKVIWMNQNTVLGVSLLQFFTEMEWGDWPESVPFLRESGHEGRGRHGTRENISISKVSANYTYPNVFGLRRHKLEIMKQIIDAVPRNVKLVRLNEVERSPEVFIQDLVREFDLTLKDEYQSQPNSPITHTTVCLTADEWDAAQRKIDWNIETEFGFSPLDCRMCYGYDKSKSLFRRVKEGKKIKQIIKGQDG